MHCEIFIEPLSIPTANPLMQQGCHREAIVNGFEEIDTVSPLPTKAGCL